jgi:hypothetical protein
VSDGIGEGYGIRGRLKEVASNGRPWAERAEVTE